MEDNFNIQNWHRNNYIKEDFNPQVGDKTYIVEIKTHGSTLIELTQDTGQSVVIHADYLNDLIEELNKAKNQL